MHEHDNDIIKKNKDSDGDVSWGVDGLPKPRSSAPHKAGRGGACHDHQSHEVDVGRSEV